MGGDTGRSISEEVKNWGREMLAAEKCERVRIAAVSVWPWDPAANEGDLGEYREPAKRDGGEQRYWVYYRESAVGMRIVDLKHYKQRQTAG